MNNSPFGYFLISQLKLDARNSNKFETQKYIHRLVKTENVFWNPNDGILVNLV